MTALADGLVIFVIVAGAMSAGLTFVFSNTIMPALERQGPDAGAAAMVAINEIILNPLFFAIFVGSALAAAVAGVLAVVYGRPGAGLIAVGAALYVVGMFGVTAGFNVPLNDQLAAVTSGTDEARALWGHYLDRWTFWNTVRTVAGAASVLLLILSRSGS